MNYTMTSQKYHKRHMLVMLFLVSIFMNTAAQGKKERPLFPMVEIPDSIRYEIAVFLKAEEHLDTIWTAFYFYNYANPKDYKFKDGVYTVRMMGPHFQSRFLICKNGKIKIFKYYHTEGLLEEFVNYIKDTKPNRKDEKQYLKLICRFLEEGLEQETYDD